MFNRPSEDGPPPPPVRSALTVPTSQSLPSRWPRIFLAAGLGTACVILAVAWQVDGTDRSIVVGLAIGLVVLASLPLVAGKNGAGLATLLLVATTMLFIASLGLLLVPLTAVATVTLGLHQSDGWGRLGRLMPSAADQ